MEQKRWTKPAAIMEAVRIARQGESISIFGKCQWRRLRGDDGMEDADIRLMEACMAIIKRICSENHGANCWECPANGKGRLCHSGELSCCAPHGWWGVEEADDERDDK
jgi:hypothetical protein